MELLPDYLPGNPPMYGVKQASTQVYYYTDVVIPVDFSGSGIPEVTNWVLTASVYDSRNHLDPVWTGTIANEGIVLYQDVYYIVIPAADVLQMGEGVWYVDVTGTNSTITAPSVTSRVLFSKTISVHRNAANVLSGIPVTTPAPIISNNLVRFSPTKGFQWYNPDTQLWHTKMVIGNPPQDAWDAGEP